MTIRPRPSPSPLHSSDATDRRRFLATGVSLLAAPTLLGAAQAAARTPQPAASEPKPQATTGSPTVTLNNGVKMPLLGLGVYQMNAEECERSIADAIEAGYRLFDTATLYGNEESVGKAVKRSPVPRDQLFVTTKVWVNDTTYDKAKVAFDRSLAKLGLDYVDLYLIHQPFNDVFGAWRALEELYRAGRIKAIGVSNFHPDRLMDLILHNDIKPAVNQIETHPFCQQTAAQKFHEQEGVQIMSWAPFAEGRNGMFQNETLAAIGKKHGKTVAQVIVRWLTQRGVVSIPKSARKDRIIENFSVFDFQLTTEDLAAIAKLDTAKSAFFDHRDPQVVKMLSGARRDR